MNIGKFNLNNVFLKKIKKSITLKLFIVTALVFIIFISSTLIIQSLFFGRFYMSKKKNDIQKSIQEFRTSYNKIENQQEVTELIRDFEESHNAKVIILDSNGKLKFITKSYSEKLNASRLKIINEVIRDWEINSNTFTEMRRDNKPITIVTEKRTNEIRNIVSAVSDNDKDEIIFTISSLQPVNEASTVIREFYIYFYIGAIFLIIILSLIYSNMISKPLLKLNEAASNMADLDFSKKCNIIREDEIGNLANTLNFLSGNLNEALSSLKEVNSKLEEDIEKERLLEKMRKEFVAAVSHELKTPISLIGGYTEGLKDGVFQGAEKDYYLDVILDESHKMGNLVSDMLDLSQLESGNFKLSKEEFNIDEVISSILKKFSTLINDKNIDLQLNLIHKVKINADWTRMEQVITNFITNAIRHTHDNGFIKISMEEKENRQVLIYVENSGIHIPDEEIDKIWDNFYKIDKSRNRKLGGTGIGLAIVKNILILHGYKYGVENTDKGVRFYLSVNNVN
jgi:two-component system, OmpR family, sensor histidine kinase VanS